MYLLYGLEALTLNQSEVTFLAIFVTRFYTNLIDTVDIDVVIACQFNF